MPVIRRARSSPARDRGRPSGPRLERVVPFRFSAADRPPGHRDQRPYVDHMRALHRAAGAPDPTEDLGWLTGGPGVSYHDMVRVVVERLGDDLAGIDLVVTVDVGPDCRHQSFPACLLGAALPGDPLVLGISEQGVAGPFTALRIAHDQLRAGLRRRALVLVLEQSTLPPDSPGRPREDVAVALLLGDGTGPRLGRPEVDVVGRAVDAVPRQKAPHAVGPPRVSGPAPAPVAAPRRPGAGVWPALAHLMEHSGGRPRTADGRLVIAERDPVLPYACRVTLTWPAPAREPGPSAGLSAPSLPEPVA
ncbi:beta-ketoacyl-[acyl-carrier-protein] synthase family protein [Streptomyces prasinus]